MLKQRIVSALVLVSLIVWALFAWSQNAFATLLGAFILVGAWEWTRLMGMTKPVERIAYVAALGLVGVWIILNPSWNRPLVLVAVVFWAWVLVEQVLLKRLEDGFLVTYPGKLLAGFLVLLPAWLVPLALRLMPQGAMPEGRWLVLYLMLVVWAADTGAYFAGHLWGRHKLAPLTSPGKTWEGVGGGLVVVLVLALLAGIYRWGIRGDELATWVAISLFVGFVSVLGDLFESRMKRIAGAKDSGTLIPGHGGVLDRIDAFTAAAPVFAYLWYHWRMPTGSWL